MSQLLIQQNVFSAPELSRLQNRDYLKAFLIIFVVKTIFLMKDKDLILLHMLWP